jgi:hypothetical protein
LPLGGPKGYGKQTLAIEFLPSVSVLKLEVMRSDGPSVFTADFEQQPVAAGDSLVVDLGAADQGVPLVVQISFTSTRVGAKRIVLNYVMQFQDTAGKLVTFERDNVQRELQLARQQRLGAFDERMLEKLESNILYYETLEKLTRLEGGEIRLHYRLFCELGGQQVDLLVADQDAR